MGKVILYTTDDGSTKLNVTLDNDTVWLSIDQMAELFKKNRATINEHILNVYSEKELSEGNTKRKIEVSDYFTKPTNLYNLDVVISVGYRIKSIQGSRFRQWATIPLKEYIIKGFTMDDERLKGIGGGNYWNELLGRIRDIRSSEKVMYRQVLELYATASDYDPKSEETLTFFKLVQNRLHFAAHGITENEVIYMRVDCDMPDFNGEHRTQPEEMIAKKFLQLKELQELNNLVAAYFNLAELNAIEQREMRMEEHVRKLDNILTSAERNYKV